MSTNLPHEYSRAEVRKEFLAAIRATVYYWSTLPEKAARERCEGVAFSILA